MSLTRRRFLTITAAALASPAQAAPARWRGFAMGAEISLTLHASEDVAKIALLQVKKRLWQVENLFSLYDPNSALSQLNTEGTLPDPHPFFIDLLRLCKQAHEATDGVFDPTIQPLWQAVATGTPTGSARAAIGWGRVQINNPVRLDHGQALSLNGIAQGYATDLIREDLTNLGLEMALINIGEFAALGGPFRLGIADPVHGLFATRQLNNNAIATSSPAVLPLGDHTHILFPDRCPQWSSVSVEAPNAATADALSTAFSLMTVDEIRQASLRLPIRTRTTLLAENGDISTIQGRSGA